MPEAGQSNYNDLNALKYRENNSLTSPTPLFKFTGNGACALLFARAPILFSLQLLLTLNG